MNNKIIIPTLIIVLMVLIICLGFINLNIREKLKTERFKTEQVQYALLVEKGHEQEYNTFGYEVYLPDYMSLWITVDCQKDYVISDAQKNLLRYAHKRIVSGISDKEWKQCGEEK